MENRANWANELDETNGTNCLCEHKRANEANWATDRKRCINKMVVRGSRVELSEALF